MSQGTSWSSPRPASFRYRGHLFKVVDVLDHWTEAGRWWELEPERAVWRVTDRAGGVHEMALERKQPPVWRLLVIWD